MFILDYLALILVKRNFLKNKASHFNPLYSWKILLQTQSQNDQKWERPYHAATEKLCC